MYYYGRIILEFCQLSGLKWISTFRRLVPAVYCQIYLTIPVELATFLTIIRRTMNKEMSVLYTTRKFIIMFTRAIMLCNIRPTQRQTVTLGVVSIPLRLQLA